MFSLPFFLYIIKDKIADERRSVSPPVTPLPHYQCINCKTPTSANGGGFQERERLMQGLENVLQTCLAISEIERKRERGQRERGTNRACDSRESVKGIRFGVQG